MRTALALFGTADFARSVAILDVVGADASLATADDATQEEILRGPRPVPERADGAVPGLVRAEPVDLDGHLRRVRDRAELLPEPLASVASDYAAFVQGLGHQSHAPGPPLLRRPSGQRTHSQPQRWADGFDGSSAAPLE